MRKLCECCNQIYTFKPICILCQSRNNLDRALEAKLTGKKVCK